MQKLQILGDEEIISDNLPYILNKNQGYSYVATSNVVTFFPSLISK